MKFKVNDVLVDKVTGRICYVHSINDPVVNHIMGKADYYSLVFGQEKNGKTLSAVDLYCKQVDKRLVKIGVL